MWGNNLCVNQHKIVIDAWLSSPINKKEEIFKNNLSKKYIQFIHHALTKEVQISILQIADKPWLLYRCWILLRELIKDGVGARLAQIGWKCVPYSGSAEN